jgi:hypothetical protein
MLLNCQVRHLFVAGHRVRIEIIDPEQAVILPFDKITVCHSDVQHYTV